MLDVKTEERKSSLGFTSDPTFPLLRAEVEAANTADVDGGVPALSAPAVVVSPSHNSITLRRDVGGNGPTGGVLILGEAPGADEIIQGIPFVGASGQILRRTLVKANLDPANLRFENVIERKLVRNDENKLWLDTAHTTPSDELTTWFLDAHDRILKCNPKVIVACGDLALKCLTTKPLSITQAHCYVLNFKGIPVVPVYHPAFIYRVPEMSYWLRFGLEKAKRVLDGRRDLTHNVLLNPLTDDALTFMDRALMSESVCIDLEWWVPTEAQRRNPPSGPRKPYAVTTIGLSISPTEALSLDLYDLDNNPRLNTEDLQDIADHLRDICASERITKVFHNFIADTLMLWHEWKIHTAAPIYDTMAVANLLNPGLRKRLADVARLYCFCPPWKDDREAEMYNAQDTLRTYEIYTKQGLDLAQNRLTDFYRTDIAPLYEPVRAISVTGLNVDQAALTELRVPLEAEVVVLSAELTLLATPYLGPKRTVKKYRDKELDTPTDMTQETYNALPIVTKRQYRYEKKTDLVLQKVFADKVTTIDRHFNPASQPQLKEVLVNLLAQINRERHLKLKLPTKHGVETTDEVSLLKLNRKIDLPFIRKLLDYRSKSKTLAVYVNALTDPDGRMRFSFNLSGTKFGRQSSSQTPWDTGLNVQNIPKDFRHIIVPDAGCQFVQVDLSQAELRMVAWLANERTLIDMLNAKQDVHQYTADMVKKMTGLEVTRQLGKRINHAANYGMEAARFSDSCLSEMNLHVTVVEAARMLHARAEAFPGIRRWHREIERELLNHRRLVTPLGRAIRFYGRLDAETFRAAYSSVPQSTVVDLTNRAWVQLHHIFKEGFVCDRTRVVQQGHDSLLIETTHMDAVVAAIDRVYATLIFNLNGYRCHIPWDVAAGNDWKNLSPFQR